MMVFRSRLLNVILIIFIFSSGIFIGTRVDAFINDGIDVTDTGLDIEKIAQIYEQVLAYHVNEDIDTEAMEVNAIKGMLKDIDGGLTRYLTPKEFADSQRTQIRGDYAGIGVVIVVVDDNFVVVAPYKNTPAERAGIIPGDMITKVNGESVAGWSLDVLAETVRGPIGTDVELTILPADNGETYDIVITREEIEIPVVNHEILGSESNIGYVSLYIFNDHSVEQVAAAVDTCIAQGAEYLILDLRGNPGGNLTACLGMADLFLGSDKTIFITKDRQNSQVVYTTKTPAQYDIPILLLIDRGSASASEVTTATLMENERALSMGTNSFGKASMQSGFYLADGDYLWVTTNTYLTPDGNYIDKVGIKPSIAIPIEVLEQDVDDPEDLALEYAIEWVEEQLKK